MLVRAGPGYPNSGRHCRNRIVYNPCVENFTGEVLNRYDADAVLRGGA